MLCTEESVRKILSGDLNELNNVLEGVVIKSVETTLRSIPVMLGKLFQVTASTHELVKGVYEKHPQFLQYKEVVIMTIQDVEAQNAGLTFDQVVERAIPLIHEKIADFEKVSQTIVNSPTARDIEQRLNGDI
jgi:hypothetical protein